MMITELDADLKLFRDVIDDFAEQYLGPIVKDTDRYPFGHTAAESIEDRFERLFQMGLLGITMPARFGGTDQGITALCMALSRIAEVDASYSGFIFTSALSQEILLVVCLQNNRLVLR
jgi:alkylation response protein AidB-like acyl-CoA dehydrogenase